MRHIELVPSQRDELRMINITTEGEKITDQDLVNGFRNGTLTSNHDFVQKFFTRQPKMSDYAHGVIGRDDKLPWTGSIWKSPNPVGFEFLMTFRHPRDGHCCNWSRCRKHGRWVEFYNICSECVDEIENLVKQEMNSD